MNTHTTHSKKIRNGLAAFEKRLQNFKNKLNRPVKKPHLVEEEVPVQTHVHQEYIQPKKNGGDLSEAVRLLRDEIRLQYGEHTRSQKPEHDLVSSWEEESPTRPTKAIRITRKEDAFSTPR